MGDTAPDNAVSAVHMKLVKHRHRNMFSQSVFGAHSLSRCCFSCFDSITVIIMEGTAPDNYIKSIFL